MVYFLQRILGKLACTELYFDIQLCQGWDYTGLKLWAVTAFDVFAVCKNARKLQIFMLGTISGLCILVKNHHFSTKKAPMDSTSLSSLKS